MNGSVLIIEDNQLNLELAADLLEASHFRVWQARTAEEGLGLARELKPDLILMDLSLPGMDGRVATRALKSNPSTRHLKVIALTAHAMKGDEDSALRAGCDGYLTKPINTRAFPRQIADFISKWQPREPRQHTVETR
ncbi:MAG TPA: response regulator [Candidatus Binatia bacterium]|jgi:CheY-like chemotaxis protein|nr:response regulator [Candidatus Binatia bacterium]